MKLTNNQRQKAFKQRMADKGLFRYCTYISKERAVEFETIALADRQKIIEDYKNGQS